MATAVLKDPMGLRYNGAALIFVIAGYGLGFTGLFHSAWAINLLATLLLAHSMTIAAYLIHE